MGVDGFALGWQPSGALGRWSIDATDPGAGQLSLSLTPVQPLGPDVRPPGATATYPLDWRLKVPAAHLDITLAARARRQFIPNRYLPGFWEGASAITSGARGGCIVESTREPMSTF
jgi:hypothetical protein